MAWSPVPVPERQIARSESAHEGIDCPVCQSPAGQPCTSRACGTWDYDDLG